MRRVARRAASTMSRKRSNRYVGVVRAGGRLGVVLHREGRDVEAGEALDDVVVQVDVGDLGAAEAGGRVDGAAERRVDREAVVVRGDADAAGAQVDAPAG